ncbi:helix-turn-helix domain-containing protein [Notoacmeibacter marinus]|uniref:helix-turn-helix domain-containing protein n=1 Tax=Notoacmeibacter marinus TaxID=1876515 RepID=UPI000DF2DD43|nr:short-chain fatty acyl-CoA regulator family protein [Notoacmeibacter marinus]
MADRKIFAGPRIRRIRHAEKLTQTAMAERLGISPSYLNLIERNQRPLTVQIILKLTSVFRIDPEQLQGESDATVGEIRQVFSDPLLADDVPSETELLEVAEAAPNVAASIVKLHRAYVEQGERLSDLSSILAKEGRVTAVAGKRMPIDEVRELLESRPNHFPAIEEAAEAFHESLSPGDALLPALKEWFRSEQGLSVRVLPVSTMPLWRRRFDRHSQRLFISERLSPFDQLREVAMEAAMIALARPIAEQIEALPLATEEARRIARFELARYAAHALMMPYERFNSAARRVRYDIDVLRSRFSVSFEQVANRLTTLRREGQEGVPFFMLEIDNAGNRFRRAGANGFPQQRFGGHCPKLAIHAAFTQPGQLFVEAVEMPDSAAFLTVSRTLEGPQGSFSERPRRTAILLGCDLGQKDEIVYGDGLPGVEAGGTKEAFVPATPIGPACRLCERQACLARAEPPITRPLGLDEMVTGLSAFDFR